MLLSIIMPGRNLDKVFLANSYYHIYNRGVNRRTIFIDDDDYRVFMNLIKRYTGKTVQKDKRGREYPNYSSDIGILAYCLMPNHFHLLIETKKNADKLTALMTSLMTAYVLYFNKKYQRVGALFGKEYRAVLIDTDAQFWHISRYIHLNPVDILDDYKR